MKTTTILLIAGGAFVAFKVLPLLNAGNQLNIVFGGVDLNNSTIHLTALNTTNTDILLNSVEADVTANGSDLGTVTMFTPVTIHGNAQTDIPLTFSTDIIGLLGLGITTVEGGIPQQIVFQAQGSYNVGGASLPLNVSKTVALAS
jgi:hypothetical protein